MSETHVRRGAGRRFDLTAALALALPVVAAGALALTHPEGWEQPIAAPETTTLTTAAVVCPSGMPGGPSRGGATTIAEGAAGPVELRGAAAGAGDQAGRLDLSSGTVTPLPRERGEVSLRARGETAPGLVAGRFRLEPLAVTDCPAPASEQWFTGLGAGPEHGSTVELVNPNRGTAVVDVAVLGPEGEVDVPGLRGVAVPGYSATSLDLAAVMPQLGDFAVHTQVLRGQVAVSVRDSVARDVDATAGTEWIPAQAAPARTNHLLGLPGRGRERVLTVANAGDSQVSVEVKIVTPQAVLAPATPVTARVAPGSVGTLDVRGLIDSDLASDAIGLQVEATGPVTSALRTMVGDDPAVTGAAAPVEGRTALVLPARVGDKSVALGGADAAGTVTVVSRGTEGEELAREEVELAPGGGAEVDLPAATALVELVPDRTTVAGAVRLSGDGVAVVPFRAVASSGSVPAVRPGLL